MFCCCLFQDAKTLRDHVRRNPSRKALCQQNCPCLLHVILKIFLKVVLLCIYYLNYKLVLHNDILNTPAFAPSTTINKQRSKQLNNIVTYLIKLFKNYYFSLAKQKIPILLSMCCYKTLFLDFLTLSQHLFKLKKQLQLLVVSCIVLNPGHFT